MWTLQHLTHSETNHSQNTSKTEAVSWDFRRRPTSVWSCLIPMELRANSNQNIPYCQWLWELCRVEDTHFPSLPWTQLLERGMRITVWVTELIHVPVIGLSVGLVKLCYWLQNNINCLPQIAIYGKNFCRSARDAFNLLMRNILK